MSGRFHWFSHIANLRTGSLVLDDPFAVPREEGSVCTYALHQAPDTLLVPDPGYPGLGAWHRVLPFERETEWPTEPLFALEPYAHELADEIGTLHEVLFNRELATSAARLAAPASGVDLGIWTNPYRIEAYKVLAMALRHGFRQPMLTFLVDDPFGELTLGLLRAHALYRHFEPEARPFRIVLVQVRPYNQLCEAFEGAVPDYSRFAEGLPIPPEPVPAAIAAGLEACQGTAVALTREEAGTDPSAVALGKLVRGRFVDEEDSVFLFTAPERLKVF